MVFPPYYRIFWRYHSRKIFSGCLYYNTRRPAAQYANNKELYKENRRGRTDPSAAVPFHIFYLAENLPGQIQRCMI